MAACSLVSNGLVATSLIVVLTMSSTMSHMVLHKVPDSIVSASGGRCLDGSSPGYYISLPQNSSSDPLAVGSWRIHLRGGGWCFTPQECWQRSKTSLGSSLLWPEKMQSDLDAHGGFMNTNSTVNPKFANWGVVYVEYCDGSSYLSDAEKPVEMFGDLIYFRGRGALRAVFLDLEDKFKLLSASKRVILSGTSAGGVATCVYCDEVARLVNAGCEFSCLPDAALFLDRNDIHGHPSYRDSVIDGLQMWNGSNALDERCKKVYAAANETWKCAFAQYQLPFVSSKLFVLNSMYDHAGMWLVLHLGCNPAQPGNCSASRLAAFQSYHLATLDALQPMLSDKTSGVFATSCYQHEESCQDPDWTGITIHSVSMRQAVEQWYDGGHVKLVDVTWPNDSSCVLNITHGPC